MPEIEIRPAAAEDIHSLIELDHTTTTEFVWQMEFHHDRDLGQVGVSFRKVRLPRAVRHDYPRSAGTLMDDWQLFSGLLVATITEKPVGYVSLVRDRITRATWVTDLVVDKPVRRQGIGTALLLSGAEFAANNDSRDIVLEMHPRNGPAIGLALKMGFEFCGYNDFYYPGGEIGIFFRKSI